MGRTDHMPRLWERGNNCPQGFILGCDEGAVRDLGALMQQVRMQGTHSQGIHISFPLPLPGLTRLFSSLTHRHCRQSRGTHEQSPQKALQQPHKSGSAFWYTECSRGACPGHFRRQGAPGEPLMATAPQISLYIPSLWHSESPQRKMQPDESVPKWNLWEKSDTCTLNPHSRGNHQGKIRVSVLLFGFSIFICYLNLAACCNSLCPKGLSICAASVKMLGGWWHTFKPGQVVAANSRYSSIKSLQAHTCWEVNLSPLAVGQHWGDAIEGWCKVWARPDVPAVSYWESLSVTAGERSSAILVCDSTWTAVLEWCRIWSGVLLTGWYQCKYRQNACTCSHSAHKLKYLT